MQPHTGEFLTQIDNTQLVQPEVARPQLIDLGMTVTPLEGACDSHIPPALQEEFANYAEMLIHYVEGILLVDDFKEHRRRIGENGPIRSDWEAQQPPAVQALLETNRLRINNLTRVFTPLTMLAQAITWTPELTPFLYELQAKIEQTADKISAQRNENIRKPFVAVEKAAELHITVEELAKRGFPADENGLIYMTYNDDSKGYDLLSLEQKLALVQEVTAVCTHVLKVFGYKVDAKKA